MSASDIPLEICELADEALADILPDKSKKIYETTYTTFTNWKSSNGIKETNETVLLAYFKTLSDKYKPTTLWSIHSQLKSMIQLNEKVNIEKFVEVIAFMRKKSHGYIPKKAKVFSAEQVETFLKTAPDDHHLCDKVVIIFGIFGALRGSELVNVKVQDVERQGNLYLVKVPVTKTMKPRSFTITGNYCSHLQKYIDLRPKHTQSDRFFLNFQKGKCTIQVVGKNKIKGVPKKMAEFLKLPNANEFTGHSFRRSSVTILTDAGGDLLTVKNLGGWKSSAVAEGYIEESMLKKKQIGSIFCKAIDLMPSTSGYARTNESQNKDSETPVPPKRRKNNPESDYQDSKTLPNNTLQEKNLNFQNCNITINFQ